MTHVSATRRSRSVRRIAAGLAALAIASTSAACGGSDDDGDGDGGQSLSTENPEPEGDPQEGGSITVALEAESNGWQPGVTLPAAPGMNVLYTIYDPLVLPTAEGGFEPFLAESIEPNPEFTAWTLKLRDGVTFHDGSALTADVLVQNLEVLQDPSSNTAGSLAEIAGATVVDPLTVRYDLLAPNAAFPDRLTGVAGMPFSMENYDALGPDGANSAPVGTGPFVFEDWRRDDHVTVRANQDYWGSDLGLGPYLDEITFRPIPDEDSRLQSMLSGDVDAFQTLRQSKVAQAHEEVRDGADLALHTFIGNSSSAMLFNTLSAPLDDPRVRRAVAHATDQQQIIDVLGGTGITPVTTQYFSEDSPYHSDAAAEAYPAYDLEAAQEELQDYIDDPQRSDGKPAGSPVSFSFACQPDASLIELAQAYQALWGQIGLEVELNQLDQATMVGNVIGGTDSNPPFLGDFQTVCWRAGAQNDPYASLSEEFGPVAEQPLNTSNYTSSTIDEQLQVLATTSTDDVDARRAAVEEIALEFDEQIPMLFNGATATLLGTRPEVQNLSTWQLPSGAEGIGTGLYEGAVTLWGQVWLTD
ncbi:ABC transporter substrate-binding protein [Blastococcus sp. SYSU D00695]